MARQSRNSRTADVLWGPQHRPRRGPKPGLSLDRIMRTAIEIADAEGLAALSMQRVAAELDCAKMALYRYTPGRVELLALMLDAALGDPPDLSDLSTEAAGWRPRLRAWALAMWSAMRRHPWVLQATVGPRVMGPNELGWLEVGLAMLAETSLSGAERLDTVVLVLGHVRNLVQQDVAPSSGAGTAEQDLATLMSGILAEHGASYPNVRAAFAATADEDHDNALEFGLERILDGLQTTID